MATLHTNSPAQNHVFGVATHIFSAIGRFFRGVANSFREARQLEELMALSDRQLDDIGLRRTEIVDFVYKGRK